jgi:nucleoside-triphosphatase
MKHILITGIPGIGKTTLIRGISERLQSFNPAGFFTEEIRERGERKGFRLISFDGTEGILSYTGIESQFKVGRYGVDINGFESFLNKIDLLHAHSEIIIIDEIGKMECLSSAFRNLLDEIFGSGKPLLATIAFKGGGIIERVKNRSDIELVEVTRDNRDALVSEIPNKIKVILENKK